MPRRKKEKYPILVSDRDRRIYEQVAVAQRTQREVAEEFKLSQPTVCKIVERVFAWMCETAPSGFAEVPRPQRLYGVARTYKMKLEWYEREAKEAWRRSQRDTPWSSTHDVIEGDDGKATLSPGKVTKKSPKADVKFLDAGKKYAAALVEFEGFAKNGAVARDNNDRLHEVPPVLPEEELDVLIRNGELAAKMKQERAAAARETERGSEGEKERVGEEEGVSMAAAEDFASLPSVSPSLPPSVSPSISPSTGALSNAAAETRLDRENVGPNESGAALSNEAVEDQTSVAPATATPSPRYSGERVGVRGEARTDSSTSLDSSGIASEVNSIAKRVPAPAPHPSPLPGVPRRGDNTSSAYIVNSEGRVVPRPKPQKIYPPTPAGYYRHGDVCRPGMIRREPVDSRTLTPRKSAKLPRYYRLSENGKEWWPVS